MIGTRLRTNATTITNVAVTSPGCFAFDKDGFRHGARFDLFLINAAWGKGCGLEDLADGFGKGLGTMGGDWSGIRDSSGPATVRMLERAINYLGLS